MRIIPSLYFQYLYFITIPFFCTEAVNFSIEFDKK